MTSGSINVLAGDFKKGCHHRYANCFFMKNHNDLLKEKIPDLSVEQIEIANNENVSSIKGAIGWGLAGSALLGPVGLLTGVIFGGKKGESITFICKFKDGRQFIGVTSSHTFSWIKQRVLVSNFEKQRENSDAPIPNREAKSDIGKIIIYTILTLIILAWLFSK